GTNDVGGLVGYFSGSSISNSYAKGFINSTAGSVGGLVGFVLTGSSVSNSFWDNQTSNQSTSAGGSGAVGLPTANMTNPFTFSNVGWNFTSVWGHNEGENSGYPFLQFQDLINIDITNPGFTQTPVISGIAQTQATLTWTPNQVVNYTLTLNGDEVSNSTLFNNSQQSLVFTGLTAGTAYTYNLTICNEGSFCTSYNNSFTTTTASSSSSSSSSGSTPTTTQAQTYTFTNAQVQSGRSQNLRVNDRIQFSARQSSNNQTSTHTLTVDQFNSASARVTIRSTPQEVTLPLNQDVLVDIDGDGVNDIIVRYTGFTSAQAQIFIQEYTREEVQTSQSESNVQEDSLNQESSSSNQNQVSTGGSVNEVEEGDSITDLTNSQDGTQIQLGTDSSQILTQEVVIEEVEVTSTNPLIWFIVSLIILLGIGAGIVFFFLKK
ncbi:MAG: fibronectin type III domain-containing protein, partial [Nanoarchaeota archaeon]|nr:fibronectin type III domain-containing protein [Nanoarchaeota archaeon]